MANKNTIEVKAVVEPTTSPATENKYSEKDVKNILKQIQLLEERKKELESITEEISTLEKQLKPFGYSSVQVKTPGVRAPRVGREPLTEENVLNFIGEESRKKGELTAHFAGGTAKVTELLTAMVKGKKLVTDTLRGKGKPAIIYKRS
jgi:hypothetical protein